MSTRSTYTIVLSLYISLFYDMESITGCFAMLMVPTVAQRSQHTTVSVITNDYPNLSQVHLFPESIKDLGKRKLT